MAAIATTIINSINVNPRDPRRVLAGVTRLWAGMVVLVVLTAAGVWALSSWKGKAQGRMRAPV
jgi:hypothetical protein